MIDITGLTSNTTYRNISFEDNASLQSIAAKQNAKTLLPSDQSVQGTDATEFLQGDATETQTPEGSQRIDIFVVRDNVFSLFKLPNGELFSKVRNLRTGEEKIFPSIDTLSYFEALRGDRGAFFEKKV